MGGADGAAGMPGRGGESGGTPRYGTPVKFYAPTLGPAHKKHKRI